MNRLGSASPVGRESPDPSRSRLVLRLIAIERSLRGVLLLAAGTYLLIHLSTDLGRLAERIIRSIDIDPRQHFFHRIVTRLHRLRAHELRIVALGYGGLELVEGVGLWLDQLWAEYMTLIATSLLIPFELYEQARASHDELPPVAVDDIVERPPIGPSQRNEWALGRVTEWNEVRADAIVREAEHAARQLLVGDCAVAAADAQVRSAAAIIMLSTA